MELLPNLAGSLGQNGFNLGNIINTASPFLQNYQNQQYAQQNLQTYIQGQNTLQNNYFNRLEGAFTKSGLPSFMAFTNGQQNSQLPRNVYNLSGSNYWTGGIAGAKQPIISNTWQSSLGWGVPRSFANGNSTGFVQNPIEEKAPITNLNTNPQIAPKAPVLSDANNFNSPMQNDPFHYYRTPALSAFA